MAVAGTSKVRLGRPDARTASSGRQPCRAGRSTPSVRIAIVRNRSRDGVISRLGPACPETYGKRTITQVVAALKAKRHAVTVLEGDKTLLMKLEELADSNGAEEEPRLLVFNMAYGIQGEARYSHVPAMLELAGVPYTGASPLGHAVSLDKPTAKRL